MSDTKRVLSMAEILDFDDIEYAEVEIFGAVVRLGSLDAGEMMEFLAANENPTKKKQAGVRLIVKSLVDENGTRIGTDADIQRFMKKSSKTLNTLVEAVVKLNAADKKEDAAKKE